jgi:DNA polymerase elongation subunit (family B)
MYRNITYSNFSKKVTLFTWNSKGERVTVTDHFKPYFYIEQQDGKDGVSIYNTKLKKIEFENDWKRKEYVKTAGINRIFYNINAEQQYLIDKFYSTHENEDFGKNPLRIFYIDIETYSKEFPNIKKATDQINVINIFDSLDNRFIVFGLEKDYTPKQDNVFYIKCKNEQELLTYFLKYWRKNFPDMVVGWNSESFDIPYIINRINLVFHDENYASRLSPVGHIRFKDNIVNRFGDITSRWYISGVALIDYMLAYKKFIPNQKSSYSLNYIGEEELGAGKLEYNAVNLTDLSDNDWPTFIDYNIQDVQLIIDLNKKLHFLETMRELAYLGMSTFESTMGTIALVTGAVAAKARNKGKIIPTFINKNIQTFSGGFVKKPITGLYEDIVTFDLNSLYPNTMITLNISPETKAGKIISTDDDNIKVSFINGKESNFTKKEFEIFIKTKQIAVSKSNILYMQSFKGIFSELIDPLYERRKNIQKTLNEDKIEEIRLKKELKKKPDSEILINKLKRLETNITHASNLEYSIKIFLNSVYGTFANQHSPFYDIDNAASITLTGQDCIKTSQNIVNLYIKNTYQLDGDFVIFQDTDSLGLHLKPLLDKLNIPFLLENKINPEVHKITEQIDKHLNQEIIKWGEVVLNSKDCRLLFKREAICSAGLFLVKKRYILHILNNKGIECDYIKYTGVEINKSDTPKAIKPLIKKVVETLIKTKDSEKTDDIFKETYNAFKDISIEKIAVSKGLKNLGKYKKLSDGFKMGKGTPMHVKSALYYNLLLDRLELTSKYEKIRSGQKMKFLYVLPNKYNIESIGFYDKYPQEFDLKIDIDKMFNKTIVKSIGRFYDAIGWKIKNPSNEFAIDMLKLLI